MTPLFALLTPDATPPSGKPVNSRVGAPKPARASHFNWMGESPKWPRNSTPKVPSRSAANAPSEEKTKSSSLSKSIQEDGLSILSNIPLNAPDPSQNVTPAVPPLSAPAQPPFPSSPSELPLRRPSDDELAPSVVIPQVTAPVPADRAKIDRPSEDLSRDPNLNIQQETLTAPTSQRSGAAANPDSNVISTSTPPPPANESLDNITTSVVSTALSEARPSIEEKVEHERGRSTGVKLSAGASQQVEAPPFFASGNRAAPPSGSSIVSRGGATASIAKTAPSKMTTPDVSEGVAARDGLPGLQVLGSQSDMPRNVSSSGETTLVTVPNAAIDKEQAASVLNQIATHTDFHRLKQGSNVQLSLEPAELGKVSLAVRLHEGSMTIQAHVSSSDVKHAMEAGVDQLRDALHEHGIDVDSLHVRVSDTTSNWTAADQDQPRSALSSGRKPHPGGQTTPQPAPHTASLSPSSSSRIDVWA